jgi:hypothetical protein
MLKRMLLMAGLILVANNIAYAENLGSEAIKLIHTEVKVQFKEKCKNTIEDATDAICDCLSNKAETSLDDKVLAECSNDQTGGECVTNAVSVAAKKALSKDNVKFCNPPLAKTETETKTETN